MTELETIWQPQAGPQTAAIHCEAYDLLFGGARGGGKTDYIIVTGLYTGMNIGNLLVV